MVVAAIRGAIGFLTSLPIGRTEGDWEAFADTPGVIPVVGYVVGAIAVLPFFLPLPDPIRAFLYVVAVYLVTGITHVDGLLDVADGVATHRDEEAALAAMADSAIGVGAVLTLGVLLLGLFALGLSVANAVSNPVEGLSVIVPFLEGAPDLTVAGLGLLGVVVAAEVGAKLGMTVLLVGGSAAKEGLGQRLAERAGRATVLLATVIVIPALFLTWPSPAAAICVAVGGAVGWGIQRWADGRFGGITGDVAGAVNEIARVSALLVGVVSWTLL